MTKYSPFRLETNRMQTNEQLLCLGIMCLRRRLDHFVSFRGPGNGYDRIGFVVASCRYVDHPQIYAVPGASVSFIEDDRHSHGIPDTRTGLRHKQRLTLRTVGSVGCPLTMTSWYSIAGEAPDPRSGVQQTTVFVESINS